MLEVALSNLKALEANPYPGRGFVVGRDINGQLVMIYWLMGRKEGSRSRVFREEAGRVFTEATDPSKITHPELVLYNAMMEYPAARIWVVSNGRQTDYVIVQMAHGKNLDSAMREWDYEPDSPNYTPRITAVVHTQPEAEYVLEMSIVKKSPWGEESDRQIFQFSRIESGFGYCLTTYSGDGNPLPPFCGEPLLMPILGTPENLGKVYWDYLNTENKVALVAKVIDSSNNTSRVRIFNRYTKMGQAEPDPDGYLVGRC